MDQLSRLPVELRQNILSRLSGADLAGCSAVCKLWRSLVNDDYLWKNLVPESERNVPMESLSREIHKHKGLEPLVEFRLRYNRHARSLAKWKRGEFWVQEVDNSDQAALIGNGALLALWRSSGQLRLYDLNGGSPVTIQKMDLGPRHRTLSGVSRVSAQGTALALFDERSFCCLIFRLKDGCLEFEGCIQATEDGTVRGSSCDSSSTRPLASRVPLLTKSSVYVLVDATSDLFVWSLEESAVHHRFRLKGAEILSLHENGNSLCVCTSEEVTVYDAKTATPSYIVRFNGKQQGVRYTDIKFQFNSRTMMGVFTCRDGWYYHLAWDTKNWIALGRPFYLDKGGGCAGAMLHPALPARACCYVEAGETGDRVMADVYGRYNGYSRHSFFVVKDLASDSILWRTQLESSYSLVPLGRRFYVEQWTCAQLSKSHVAYFYNAGDNFLTCYVVDLTCRRFVQTKIRPCGRDLECCLGPKVITWQRPDERSHRKLFVFS